MKKTSRNRTFFVIRKELQSSHAQTGSAFIRKARLLESTTFEFGTLCDWRVLFNATVVMSITFLFFWRHLQLCRKGNLPRLPERKPATAADSGLPTQVCRIGVSVWESNEAERKGNLGWSPRWGSWGAGLAPLWQTSFMY
jgi:hypothetical protein